MTPAPNSKRRIVLFAFLAIVALLVLVTAGFLVPIVWRIRAHQMASRTLQEQGQLIDQWPMDVEGRTFADHWDAFFIGPPVHVGVTESANSSQAIALIGKLRNVQMVACADVRLQSADIETISRLRNLKYLNLSGTNIADDDLPALLKLTNLTKLMLARTEVSDQGIVTLHALPELRRLHVECAAVTQAGALAWLDSAPRPLMKIFWAPPPSREHRAAQQVLEAEKVVVELQPAAGIDEHARWSVHLTDDYQGTGADMQRLGDLDNLQTLGLYGTSWTDERLATLPDDLSFVRLTLEGTRLSPSKIRTLVQLPGVRELQLSRQHLPNAEMSAILTSKPNLQIVSGDTLAP